MKKTELKSLIKEIVKEEIDSKKRLNEDKKERFVFYTNPNNITNVGYIAWGSDVKKILQDSRKYSGSVRILYQGRGTREDAREISSKYFRDYSFRF